MNRHNFYSKFRDLWAFWDSNFGFSPRKEGLRRKVKSAIDRARRDLSGTIIGFVGTGIEANRFQ